MLGMPRRSTVRRMSGEPREAGWDAMFDLQLFGDLRRLPGRRRPFKGRSIVEHDMTNHQPGVHREGNVDVNLDCVQAALPAEVRE